MGALTCFRIIGKALEFGIDETSQKQLLVWPNIRKKRGGEYKKNVLEIKLKTGSLPPASYRVIPKDQISRPKAVKRSMNRHGETVSVESKKTVLVLNFDRAAGATCMSNRSYII